MMLQTVGTVAEQTLLANCPPGFAKIARKKIFVETFQTTGPFIDWSLGYIVIYIHPSIAKYMIEVK